MTNERAWQSLGDYARLSPDLVIAAVEHAGFVCDARVFALNSYENRVYQVGIEDALPLIAKFYRPARWTDAQIREEHQFARELLAAELPVIAPIADAQGETLFRYGDYRFALFPRKGGQGMEAGDAEQLYRIGMLLGRVHQVAQHTSFAHRPALTAQRFLADASEQVCQRIPSDLRAAYMAIVTELTQRIEDSGITQAVTIRTQGDCHVGNILWTRDDGPWLLDFDDCQAAPAVQDLWMLLCGDSREQALQIGELLAGYEQFADFDVKTLSFIEPLRSMRMVHHAGWLALRWDDPAFPSAFPWFGSSNYWQSHLQDLQSQLLRLQEPPLRPF